MTSSKQLMFVVCQDPKPKLAESKLLMSRHMHLVVCSLHHFENSRYPGKYPGISTFHGLQAGLNLPFTSSKTKTKTPPTHSTAVVHKYLERLVSWACTYVCYVF